MQYVNCTYTQIISLLFHLTGVSGKEGAIQLASKALTKKSTDRSFHYKDNAIIETAPEENETLQQVKIDSHTHTECQTASVYTQVETNTEHE